MTIPVCGQCRQIIHFESKASMKVKTLEQQ